MTKKNVGFLNFGHWIHRPGGEPDAKAALDDVVQMAVDAEAAGLDGAWIRIHHFQRMFSSPFPILAAMAARTERISLGTGVIDLRYENPLAMAEAAATTDPSSGWSYTSQKMPVEPQSPGLADRIWWGCGSTASAVRAAQEGYHMLSSTLLLQDDGRPFHVQQADQIARYLDARAAAGVPGAGRTAVTRSAFVIQDDEDELYFGRERRSQESAGHLDGGAARSGPTYAGSTEEVAEKLAADTAVQAADWVLFANPNQLGAAYNAKIFAGWAEVWRLLGWDR